MILLDAIFILELFQRKYEKDSRSSKAHVEDSKSTKAHKEDSENSKAHKEDSGNSKADQIDYILSRPWLERGILHDLILLENQLPFFVLEMLYQKFYQNEKPDTNQKPTLPTLFQLSCRFFGDLDKYHGRKPESWFKDLEVRLHRPQNPRPSSLEPKNDEVKSVKHFTDLVRYFFCPTKTEKTKLEPNCCIENVRNNTHLHGTATKLDEAGLKLTKPKPKPDSERELLQIQFPENKCLESCPWLNLSWLLSCLPFLKSIDCLERRVRPRLEVPPLLLDDKIEGLFRNLMALEQCHYPSETYICDYIVLLDDLITTKEDVRLLVEKKIIVNELGSSAAVTKLVNNLALEIEESGNCDYKKLCEKVNDYYKSSWNRLVGILTRTYFSDFFKGTATVVGIIILVLTLWNFQRLVRLSARKYYI
ncbi:hypothetical protein I3760_14G024500 [Carya illinoinensis]|nr:hypothetical protein I3760_14G024500 [Carya illinoinensis]KAG2669222.1 hypothetical protein I3760_14G024500 [Carya illinoinensis]